MRWKKKQTNGRRRLKCCIKVKLETLPCVKMMAKCSYDFHTFWTEEFKDFVTVSLISHIIWYRFRLPFLQFTLPTRSHHITVKWPTNTLHTGQQFFVGFQATFFRCTKMKKKVKSAKRKVRWAFETTYYKRALRESTLHTEEKKGAL